MGLTGIAGSGIPVKVRGSVPRVAWQLVIVVVEESQVLLLSR